jgi:hypothetical protein
MHAPQNPSDPQDIVPALQTPTPIWIGSPSKQLIVLPPSALVQEQPALGVVQSVGVMRASALAWGPLSARPGGDELLHEPQLVRNSSEIAAARR